MSHTEKHGTLGSSYVKSITFGGLDGIITTFSIVAAVVGASLPSNVVLTMGFANLLADAISMGVGDYLSETAELTYIQNEVRREREELEATPDLEMAEMLDLYKARGVSDEDAKGILSKMIVYKDLFLEHMLSLELGFQLPDGSEQPWKNGLVTFGSFVLFGSVPMWVYVINKDYEGAFPITCACTAVTMFLLGASQAKLTKQNFWMTGLKMMLNGGIAAASAYFIGWGIEHALDAN